MADEAKITAKLLFAKGNIAAILRSLDGVKFDVSGDQYLSNVQNIGTSEEALDVGSLGSLGWCFMRNLDATNFVSVRPATGVADMLKLKAGEACVFRWDDGVTAPFAIADTAAVNLEYVIVED